MPVLAFFAAFFGVRLLLAVMRGVAWRVGWVFGYLSEFGRGRPIGGILMVLGVVLVLRQA